MPIRLTCPSCSATLAVKDEHAGRAVKCPKCGGVIPAEKPPAPPPPPPPPPEPAKPAAPPPEKVPKITGRPVVGSGDWAETVDEDDDPAPAPRKKRRARRDDDDDRDDRPSGVRTPNNSGVWIVLILCGTFLTCCGGVGFGVWWFTIKVKETVQKGVDEVQRVTSPVTLPNYQRLQVGTTTRAEAERLLGTGRPATTEDVEKAFPDDFDQVDRWVSMVVRNRAVIWQNGNDRLLAAFHPNAEAAGRLQLKAWRPANGANDAQGEPNDPVFLRAFPPPNPNAPKPSPPQPGDKTGPAIAISAADLIGDYKDDRIAADKRYLNKRLLVTGVVDSWENEFTAHVVAPGKPTLIRVVFLGEQQEQIAKHKKGDTIRFRGTLTSGVGVMAVTRGWIVP